MINFQNAANFLFNFSFNWNTRFLISGQVFNQSLWILVQMKTTCFKTLKLNNLSKILGERCETGPPLWRHLRKFFKTKKKKYLWQISVARACSDTPGSHFFFRSPPFQNLGLKVVPTPSRKGDWYSVSHLLFKRSNLILMLLFKILVYLFFYEVIISKLGKKGPKLYTMY